jgi:G:T-mismatch repair DNA endonuclease (very short patch repair protein)
LSENHFIQSIYALFARLGVDPHEIEVDYDLPKSESHVAIAIPSSKIGISLEGDELDGFDKKGWYITRFNTGELETFRRVFDGINVSAFEHTRRVSQAGMKKQGSKEEEKLLKGLLNANIPNPNRNLRLAREDGSELTTPDFVWEDIKLAFFMDGLWWHVTKDDTERMKLIAESATDKAKQNVVLDGNRAKATKDADIRSELSSQGWTVLSCTDEDLATDEGVKKQVERIAKTLRQKKKELRQRGGTVSEPEDIPDVII